MDLDEDMLSIVKIITAALLFAMSDDATDHSLTIAFDNAERFTTEAERRYGETKS
jgi:hypothetical protein